MQQKSRFLVTLVLVLSLASNAHVAGAQAAVRILESRHSARFGQEVAFYMVAESDDTIEAVTLYYRRTDERVTSRVVPEFEPGRHVEASYERTLERGEIPPGTAIEYYWRLELAGGDRVETTPVTFVYEDDRFEWKRLEADQVALHHYGGEAEGALASELLERSRDTLARLQTAVGVTLERPVRIYVYRSTEDMAAALALRSEGFDERVLTLGVAVADDALLLLGDHPDVRQTLAHELSHIVVGLATENPYAPLPRWLDEGLAMYAEGELPPANARALKRAIAGDSLISVRSLSGYTGDASQVDLYYGEVYSLVDYVVRAHGRDKMSELLQVFKQGTYQDDALKQVYGLSIDELDTGWRKSLGLAPRATAAPASTAAPRPRQRRSSEQPCPASAFAGVLILAAVLTPRRARPG